MAFGRVLVMPIGAKKPKIKREPEKKVEIKPAVREKSLTHLNTLVVAGSSIEAADFLCGVYFSMSHQLAGGEISVYTTEFGTISRLTEIKQDLEEGILKPVGKDVWRRSPEEGEPLSHCTLTVGQSGNQALAMDLECRWVAPGTAGGMGADLAFVLVNWAEGPEAAATMKAAVAGLSCPVVWVICGFESKTFFWGADDSPILKNAVRDALRQELGIAGKSKDVIAYAQLYGGLEFVQREPDGSMRYRTYRQCREYVPVGCHAGVLAAAEEALRQKGGESSVETLRQMLQRKLRECKSWYTVCGTEGGSEK